jgi:hypothetical protein
MCSLGSRYRNHTGENRLVQLLAYLRELKFQGQVLERRGCAKFCNPHCTLSAWPAVTQKLAVDCFVLNPLFHYSAKSESLSEHHRPLPFLGARAGILIALRDVTWWRSKSKQEAIVRCCDHSRTILEICRFDERRVDLGSGGRPCHPCHCGAGHCCRVHNIDVGRLESLRLDLRDKR